MGHQGPKTSKVVFLGDTNRLLTTGFGKQFERQVAIWDAVGIFFKIKFIILYLYRMIYRNH
jgi:hypothetical protein